MNVAPTVAHCVWLPAPRGGRIFAWGGPAQKPLFPVVAVFKSLRLGLMALGAALLTACGSQPPTPDWQVSSLGASKSFTAAFLAGDSRVADFEFARTRQQVAATGRPDLVGRVELVRCAVKVASLDMDSCAAAQVNAPDLAAPERAYAAYLGGTPLDAAQIALLPEAHRPVFSARDDGARVATLTAMTDPLARLVAAGVLFSQAQLPHAGVAVAVNTASDQGWRRPLLAWLGVQLKLAESAGDADGKARIQRRIDLVAGSERGKP